jgi:micrococcal nuclease
MMDDCGAPEADRALEEKLSRVVCGRDFTFAGQRFLAKIVDYYDGDTVRVAFEHGGSIVQYKARLAGYDSPEMKPPKTNPNRAAEKAAAVVARAALIERVSGALVNIECGEFDKYGRILVTVYLRGGENLNAWMVAHGHGTPYDGGAKAAFAS